MLSTILPIAHLPLASLAAASVLPFAAVVRSRVAKRKIPAQDFLMEKLPDGVMVLDAKSRILKINPSMRKIIGGSRREFVGLEAREAIPVWAEWQRSLRENKGMAIVPSPFQAEPILEIHRWTMRNSAGKPGRTMLLVRDVTERVRSDADYKRSTNLLQEQSTQIQSLRTSLQEQALRDPVTNLYNRCYLSETLAREVARAGRSQAPVAVMMISLDQLHETNMAHGYKAGMEMFKIAGSLLIRHIRRGDVASRYSAEEFVVVMPGAPLAVTSARAEQLRTAFQNSILNYLGSTIHSTFSCGIAVFPEHGATPEELLRSASKALEKSSSAGGNRVTVFA
jgi:diguanylate cyclase (GGDEF)-like protein/PAS domain S-box-containing protein